MPTERLPGPQGARRRGRRRGGRPLPPARHRRGALVGRQGHADPRRGRLRDDGDQRHRGHHRPTSAPSAPSASWPTAARCSPPRSTRPTCSARWPTLAVPEVADWVAVHMPGDSGIELVALAHRDPERLVQARASSTAQMPTPPRRPARRGERARGPASPSSIRTSRSSSPSTDDERARAEHVRAFGMRSALVVPMNARGRDARDAHARHRPVRPPLRRARPGAGRGARAALRHGGRQRAPVLGARLHRAHAAAEPAAGRAARHPGHRGGRPLPADRRGQRGRRRLLRPVRERAGAAGRS